MNDPVFGCLLFLLIFAAIVLGVFAACGTDLGGSVNP